MNVYDKINNHINELKISAKQTARKDAQHLNVFAFIGHGHINDKNEALFLVNSKQADGNIETYAINVDKLAKDLAEI